MSAPPRLVLDTNVVVSGLLWNGSPAELLEFASAGKCRLVASDWMVAELQRSLAKPRLAKRISESGLTIEQHVANYLLWVQTVDAPPLRHPVSRDPDDDNVLACALAAKVSAVVTGDDDLLALAAWEGIGMLSVRDCLEVVTATSSD